MNQQNNPKIHILLVEDDEFMQAILKEILQPRYRIDIRPDGIDALTFLQNGNIPDLIISDLNTPNMSGLELIEQHIGKGIAQFLQRFGRQFLDEELHQQVFGRHSLVR